MDPARFGANTNGADELVDSCLSSPTIDQFIRAVDNAGNAYVAGATYGKLGAPNAGYTDVFLAKYDATGDLLWSSVINPHFFTIITQAPVVRNGVVFVGAASAEENAAAFIPGYVCCTFRGSFSALNATTGAVL